MAVDYFHRLIVEGPPAAVAHLRQSLRSEQPRVVARKRWIEVVPFSFQRLYTLAPAACRAEREVPYDPYDLAVWPIKRLSAHRALLRYQFHTRNLEVDGLLRPLSRACPTLRFALVTLYLDTSIIATCLLSKGKARTWVVSERLQSHYWDRARRRFRLAGDDVYDSDEASNWVDDRLLAVALRHWRAAASFARGVDLGRLNWSNQAVLRDIETERELAVIELSAKRR